MHSTHSCDSRASFDKLCENAIREGLSGICVTDHVGFDEADRGSGCFEYRSYMDDVKRYREKYGDRLAIATGVEVTYQKEAESQIRSFLDTYEFDYVLGSVHLIDHVFVASPEYFSGKTEQEAYEPYFRETIAMLDSGLFTRIGHMDYVKTRRPEEYGTFSIERWKHLISEILRRVVAMDATIEVNTSAMRKGFDEPYPSWDILALYNELGGRSVFMGSDAHSDARVGLKFVEVADRLEKLGLSQHATPLLPD